MTQATFSETIYDAALDARCHVTVVDKRMQARDHPVLLGVPETYYLKCLISRKLGQTASWDSSRRAEERALA